MTWIEAENEIVRLLPNASLLGFGFTKDVWPGRVDRVGEIKFYVTAVFDGDSRDVQRFDGESWAEVITKINIWNVPAIPGDDGYPEEAALKASASTVGQQPAGQNVNESVDCGAVATSPDLAAKE